MIPAIVINIPKRGNDIMAFMIKNIFELDILKGAALITGEKSINNKIVWVNVMEILDSLDSLQKDELLVTTGYQLDREDLYGNLIYKLKKRGLAGIAIQPGYYIDKIPEYLINQGNIYEFPIIKIPSEITFSHITRAILKNIYDIKFNSNGKVKRRNVQNALFNLMKSGKIESSEENEIEKVFRKEENTCKYLFSFSISHIDDGIVPEHEISESINKIVDYLNLIKQNLLFENAGNNTLFLVSSGENYLRQDIMFGMTKVLSMLSCKNSRLSFVIGASKFSEIKYINDAYKECEASKSILERIGVKKGICFFDDIGFYKTLGILKLNDYSNKFTYENLKPLIDYDSIHNSSYLDTLKYYILNSCNINSTSEKLFIHRHTLKYRLDKISELCRIDFKDAVSMLKFSLAIYLYDLFN